MEDIFKFSLYDLLNEADDDDTADTGDTAGDAADSGEDANTDDAPQEEEANDDDFDIDTNIDDPEGGGDEDEDSGDDGGDGDTDTDLDSGSSSGGGDEEDGNETPNKANTNIFDSLSPEEQATKILELKRLYKNLYNGVDDILDRVQNISISEDELEAMQRVTGALTELKSDISYYFSHIFADKSYIENDIKFTQFLIILKSISIIIDDISARKEKQIDK